MRITKAQFKGLDQYKYSGVDKSVVSKHILGPFWTWLVTCFPRTLAPNTVGPQSATLCALYSGLFVYSGTSLRLKRKSASSP